jgi:hypothetical protein
MHRVLVALALIGLVITSPPAARAGRAQGGAASAPPTFSRDVAPILHAQCTTCHRPGEAAPMSLLTYGEARPWAAAIGRRVAEGSMPPWHGDAPLGTFENERRLTPVQQDVIARWVAAGAPQGDPAETPPSPNRVDGWHIGTPDAVFEMDEAYTVPANGTIEYEYFYIPTDFAVEKWLQAIEVRPGNRAVVHHVLVYYTAQDSPQPAVLRPNREHSRIPPRVRTASRAPRRLPGTRQLIATYAPGTSPQVFRPGTALRMPPRGVLELQMHYTANGTAVADRTRVGMIFAREAPATAIRASNFVNAQFTIPPGASDHDVSTDVELLTDATLWGLLPHTHVRGTRWKYVLRLPDGTERTLLSVPKYDFNWQTFYMFKEPVSIPRGARIVSTAWYDNSARNRSNPDPTLSVRWGDQTWEEMQYTGLLYSAP